MENPLQESAATALAEVELARAIDAANRYARKSHADSTQRAYRSDWRQFEAWCATVALAPLPATAETVALFLASQADLRRNPSTLTRRLAAIRLVHLGAGHPSPHDSIPVQKVMKGIRRDCQRPPQQKAAAVTAELMAMVQTIPGATRRGLRNRALLLLGFAGAFRRSELVALDASDLTFRRDGVQIIIRASKTDQEGRGQVIGIPGEPASPFCPVRALRRWQTAAQVVDGALFRRMYRGDVVSADRLSDQTVAAVVKECAHRAGLPSARYAGHSLRRGFLTSAARNRASIFKMADQSRHRSLDVLRQYVKAEELFEDHAGKGLLSLPTRRDREGAE